MDILVIVILIGLLPASIAKSKGRSFVLWWLYGSALFIIALPHSLMMRADTYALEKRQLADGMKKCPSCAELVKYEAAKCRFCGQDLAEAPKDYGIYFDGKYFCVGQMKFVRREHAVEEAIRVERIKNKG